jgi:hypothetical protein
MGTFIKNEGRVVPASKSACARSIDFTTECIMYGMVGKLHRSLGVHIFEGVISPGPKYRPNNANGQKGIA